MKWLSIFYLRTVSYERYERYHQYECQLHRPIIIHTIRIRTLRMSVTNGTTATNETFAEFFWIDPKNFHEWIRPFHSYRSYTNGFTITTNGFTNTTNGFMNTTMKRERLFQPNQPFVPFVRAIRIQCDTGLKVSRNATKDLFISVGIESLTGRRMGIELQK